jgi:hypothetical protein
MRSPAPEPIGLSVSLSTGRGHLGLAADDGRVPGTGQHGRTRRLAKLRGRPGVVDMAVGQHDSINSWHRGHISAPEPGAPVSIKVTESPSRQR